MSGPSEKAIEMATYALADYSGDLADREPSPAAWREVRRDATIVLKGAHDPALGLDRSVCLRDVVDWLQQYEGGFYARETEREFGGGS